MLEHQIHIATLTAPKQEVVPSHAQAPAYRYLKHPAAQQSTFDLLDVDLPAHSDDLQWVQQKKSESMGSTSLLHLLHT